MQILSAEQIRALDAYTIEHEPIASVDLMERATAVVFNQLTLHIKQSETIYIYCGMGNNGGDGLAIARMLLQAGYAHVFVFVVKHSAKASADFLANEQRFKTIGNLLYVSDEKRLPKIPAGTIVLDAIFGTGLSKPVTGLAAAVIKSINKSNSLVYAIDLPSGLYADKLNGDKDAVVCADMVYTFHAPKLSFLLPATGKYVPDFKVLDIGLNTDYETQLDTPYEYITASSVELFFKQRSKFSHKGTYGHALVAAGSFGKIGAAVLSIKATLRSGAGLVSTLIPVCGYEIMQSANPEAMVMVSCDSTLCDVPDLKPYTAVAVGPGIGKEPAVHSFMQKLLSACQQPMVIDADALNIIAENKKLLKLIPENSILTPHPGEFKRLVGEWSGDLDKLKLQTEFSKKYKVVIVLKGAHTSISTPQGKIYFNSTGNAG
ncbi:MAG TPA: NAD(P)H-hydrate dehydratase, partial [Chitinophagales bacterium]|nr:NAD(P)H-hydrate dehydratase [Chitinophagales bacterium]